MKKIRKLLIILTAVALFATACGSVSETPVGEIKSEVIGEIALSVNPDIGMKYDERGIVKSVFPKNDDGKKILENYTDYVGKHASEVAEDLVKLIDEKGYFVEEIKGKNRDVVLKLEPGSKLPSKTFLADTTARIKKAILNLNLESNVIMIDVDDYDDNYKKENTPSRYITMEKAKEIALAHAGVNLEDVKFDDKEFDHDDGMPIFELEFETNGLEYEYDIHAETGKILKFEIDTIDDIDDDIYDDLDDNDDDQYKGGVIYDDYDDDDWDDDDYYEDYDDDDWDDDDWDDDDDDWDDDDDDDWDDDDWDDNDDDDDEWDD